MTFVHNINPTIAQLGPFELRWYGLMYVLTFVVVYIYVRNAAKRGIIKLTESQIDTLMIAETIALIIGARIFEILLYNPSYYFSHPLEMLAVWHGGLSFHGGLLAVIAVGYLFARKYKIPFLKLCDVFVVPLALGQVLGRIGNFINGELYGKLTNLPWGIKFPAAEGFRHPTQLYEAFYNTIIFATLFWARNKKFKDGFLLSLFLVLYSIFRFLVEFIREPEVLVGPLTMGQLLCIPMLAAGIWLLAKTKQK